MTKTGQSTQSGTGTSHNHGVAAESEQTLGQAVAEAGKAEKDALELGKTLVRELAREEISAWQKKRPRVVDPRTWSKQTIGGAMALMQLAIVAIAFEIFASDEADLARLFHRVVDTETHVDETLLASFEKVEFKTGVKTALDEYTTIGGGSPVTDLIGRTMRQSPVLAFHGEKTLGRSFELSFADTECQSRLRQAEAQLNASYDLPAPDGEEALRVEDVCAITGLVNFDTALDIPFHARFFEGRDRAPGHRVWLVFFIERTNPRTDREVRVVADANGRPPGLCILYKPASPAAGVSTVKIETFERTGNGFWTADISNLLKQRDVWKTRPGNPEATTFLHSLVIDIVTKDPYSVPAHCSTVTPVKDQFISVRAMILVNKSANE